MAAGASIGTGPSFKQPPTHCQKHGVTVKSRWQADRFTRGSFGLQPARPDFQTLPGDAEAPPGPCHGSRTADAPILQLDNRPDSGQAAHGGDTRSAARALSPCAFRTQGGEVSMSAVFLDRVDAGRQLATKLGHLAGRPNLVVLGLPRGGVPVAAEVANALGGQLDVLVVRKLGVPGREELAMGAVASGGVRVINADVVDGLGIPEGVIDEETVRERREVERRERAYRGDRPYPDLRDATVVLVDDGVATGATMLAAIRALRQHHPATLVAAAGVMSESARQSLSCEADACVTVATPEPFYGVGTWFRDFTQTSDAEVLALLARSALVPAGTGRPGKQPGHASNP